MAYIHSSPASSGMEGLIEISGSDDMQSINDDASVKQEANNRRLAQAVNYMQQEGGQDSYMTFMDRVQRIDEALLKQLRLHDQNFDPNLYQQLQTLILQAKREYNEAIEGFSSRMEIDEETIVDYTPPSFQEALERRGSEPASPTPAPTRRAPNRKKALGPRRGEKEDNVERVRKFKYGGPNNEPENWHRDFPAILPFPETLMMAHWESLKINYDLARPKDSKSVETNVPLNHPSLEKYFHLPIYESGSRFKLPAVSEELQKQISRHGTGDLLRKVVDEFYDPDASYDNADYAPRVFLEKFKVGTQMPPNTVSPSQVRRALASTPIQPRSSILRKGTIPSKRTSPPLMEDCNYDTDNMPASFTNAGPSSRVDKTPRSTSRTPQPEDRASPAFRRISGMVRATEAEEARIEQTAAAKSSLSSSSSKPNLKPKVASHVAVSPKRRPGRPRRVIEPAAPKVTPSSAFKAAPSRRRPSIAAQPYTLPPEQLVHPTFQSAGVKRKLSQGSQPYAAPDPIHETPRKRRKSTPGKTVNFTKPLHEEPESVEEIHEVISRARFPMERTSGKGKVTKKTSKAAAAGKAVKQRNEAKKKVVEKAGMTTRKTTRSGASYTV